MNQRRTGRAIFAAARHGRPGQLGRRLFLAGSAGTLALPLLDSLSARAQEPPPPLRLILVYTANGTYPDQWFPSAVRSSTDFDLAPIHTPLAPYQDKLVLMRGAHNSVAQDSANNGGPHQRGIGALFTGQLLQTGEFQDGCGATAGWADGISIDQRVAQLVGMDTPFPSLELGVRCFDNDVQGRISYSGPGAPLPPVSDPVSVYARLFAQKPPPDPSRPESRQKSVLDAVHEQYAHLSRRVGRADREKLDAHLTLVEDLERRLGLGGVGLGGADGAARCPTVGASPDAVDADAEDLMPQISRTQIDLLVAALSCDLTRVASLQYSTGFNRLRYPWLDSLSEGHTLSHSGDSQLEAWEELGRRQQWHAAEIAYLLERLGAIQEGEGTLLDSTLVVWGSEVSQGNSHSLNDIPFLLAGGAGGRLAMGQFLELGGRSHADLLLTITHAFGGSDSTFGHPSHQGGLIEELLA